MPNCKTKSASSKLTGIPLKSGTRLRVRPPLNPKVKALRSESDDKGQVGANVPHCNSLRNILCFLIAFLEDIPVSGGNVQF